MKSNPVRFVALGALAVAIVAGIGCSPGGYYRPAYTGTLLGGTAGGVMGYNMTGGGSTDRWRGAAIGTAAGALFGYVMGNAVERSSYAPPAPQYYPPQGYYPGGYYYGGSYPPSYYAPSPYYYYGGSGW